MTKKERIQNLILELEEVLEDLREEVGEENFNFVASITIFDKKREVDQDNSLWWSVGDVETSKVSAECLVEAIQDKEQMDKLFDITLN
jgi:uncharacterized protein (UPF0218 family)